MKNSQKVHFFKHNFEAFPVDFRTDIINPKLFSIKNRIRRCAIPNFSKFKKSTQKEVVKEVSAESALE